MLDKRKLKRRHLIYYLRVMDRDSDNLVGFLVDITTQGIMIMSESSLEVDKLYHFKMLVQTEMSSQEYLHFEAQCIWSKKSVNSDFYDNGFKLLNISPKDFQGIEKIIEELGFRD